MGRARTGVLALLVGFAAMAAPIMGSSPSAGADAPPGCPKVSTFVVIDCNLSDPSNSHGMFAGAMERYGTGWIVAYMKDWTSGSTTYRAGYTSQNPNADPMSDAWGSIAQMWKPQDTDAQPGVIDPGLHVFGADVDVATEPSQIYSLHSTNPGTEDSFVTPAAQVVCTGDQKPGCMSTEGSGHVAEVSLRPADVPANGTVYAIYSFCPTSAGCSVDKPQEIHLRTVPKVITDGQYAPWGSQVVCARDSGWANASGNDKGHHQRAVVVTLSRSGGRGTKMACIYNHYEGGGARTIGMTTSTDGSTWPSNGTVIAREPGFDLHNPYAIWMLGTSGTVRVYYQRYNYDGHCSGLGRNWTLNYVESKDGGATWTMPLGSTCTGITYPKEISSTSRPIFAQQKAGGHVYCMSTWILVDTTILGIFDTQT